MAASQQKTQQVRFDRLNVKDMGIQGTGLCAWGQGERVQGSI